MIPQGYQRSPADGRDLDFADLEERLRSAGRLEGTGGVMLDERTPISDQGPIGSCVACATCDACELVMPHPVQLSRLFIYWNARRRSGEECVDGGTFPRAAFASVTALGAPLESAWPYDVARVNERPSLGAYEGGFDHKIASYYAIKSYGTARLDAIESALRAGLPVVFGTDVGAEFQNTRGRDPLHPPLRSEGGHALVVVGFESYGAGRVWRIRNSWGRGHGDAGYCLFADDYMTDLATSDFWVPVHVDDVAGA